MKTVHKKIVSAIQHAKLVNSYPTDCLSFFYLEKRDGAINFPDGVAPPVLGRLPDTCRISFIFMVCANSKMAIFDNECIMIGSANVNERSMSGRRDSEMAFGSYQHNLVDDGDTRAF